MEVSKMKNMVVLRNLPSNIVDEAFVVLKSNKKAKKLEKIEKNKNQISKTENKKDKENMLKEAEMLISDYISQIEKKDNTSLAKKSKTPKKYKKFAYISTSIALIEFVMLIF